MKYVDVAPAIPLQRAKHQVFTYHVREDISLHQLVQVPFGRRTIKGVVIDAHSRKPHYRTKEVQKILPARISPGQVAFAQWIASTMQGGLGYTLRLCMPPGAKEEETTYPALKKNKQTHEALVAPDADRFKKMAARIQKESQQTLVLVPELWMISYLQEQLKAHGVEATTFSGDASIPQQRSVWYGVANGDVSVVIGTQKALYLPYRQLGLVVLEQEQYGAHKLWDQYPRLDNKVAAGALADIHGASLLFSGAFASVALRRRILEKEVRVLEDSPKEPLLHVIEASLEDRRARRLLPNDFVKELKLQVKAKKRILLLYNQLDTGQKGRKGFGTETLERVFEAFPALKKQLLRIDRRSRKEKDIAEELKTKRVVFGTSAVLAAVEAMEFDYVAWLFPERTLSYPDYRTTERSVTLLARLQEYLPEKQAVTVVTRNRHVVAEILGQSAEAYYETQLKERKRYFYPPFSTVIKLTVVSKTEETANERASLLRKEIEKRKKKTSSAIVRGPFQDFQPPAPEKHTAHVLLQGDLNELVPLYDKLPIDGVDVQPQRIL